MMKINLLISQNFDNYIQNIQKKWPYLKHKNQRLILNKKGLLFADEIIADLFLI